MLKFITKYLLALTSLSLMLGATAINQFAHNKSWPS